MWGKWSLFPQFKAYAVRCSSNQPWAVSAVRLFWLDLDRTSSLHAAAEGGPSLHGGVASPSTWRTRHATMKTRRKEYRLHDNYYVEKLHARWWLSASSNSLHWSCGNCCVPALYRRGQVTVSHNPAPAGKLKDRFLSFFITKCPIVLAWQSNKCENRRIAWEICSVKTAHSASYITTKITAIHIRCKGYTCDNKTGNVCMNVALKRDRVTSVVEKQWILHILRWAG